MSRRKLSRRLQVPAFLFFVDVLHAHDEIREDYVILNAVRVLRTNHFTLFLIMLLPPENMS